VTPAHAERLQAAEALFDRFGIDRLTYLLVPDYHAAWDIRRFDAFAGWCRAPRCARVQWFLHGYFHRAAFDPAAGLMDRIKQRCLTAGEGEFLSLRAPQVQARVNAGVAILQDVLGVRPDGFVAPAWLTGRHLGPALEAARIPFTEDHRRIYDIARGRTIACPVITWATRTRVRKYGSIVACPALLRAWSNRPVLRLALHPADFDHRETLRSIERVLELALRTRVPAAYDADLF